MTLAEKKAELIERLGILPTAQDRLMYIVEKAKKHPGLPPELKTGERRVEGCLSNLWFVPEERDGYCYFRSDADSHIVKAVALLLCDYYSGHRGAEIATSSPEFLSEVGITQHLSPNRRNGLTRLWDMIRIFAQSHPGA